MYLPVVKKTYSHFVVAVVSIDFFGGTIGNRSELKFQNDAFASQMTVIISEILGNGKWMLLRLQLRPKNNFNLLNCSSLNIETVTDYFRNSYSLEHKLRGPLEKGVMGIFHPSPLNLKSRNFSKGKTDFCRANFFYQWIWFFSYVTVTKK